METPTDIPPIWPDIKTELQRYVECIEDLPIYKLENAQCYFPREPDLFSLLNHDVAPLGSTLTFNRDPLTGQLREMHEIELKSAGETSRNSVFMSRAPGSRKEGVRGDSSSVLFWPGGFDEPNIIEDPSLEIIDFENNLRTLPRGFSSGIEFKTDNCTPKEGADDQQEEEEHERTKSGNASEKINLMAIVHEEGDMLGLWPTAKEMKEEPKQDSNQSVPSIDDITNILDNSDIPVLKISGKVSNTLKSEWAEQLDVSVPVTDFEKRIPDPALSFPYELDTFQKQAILKLEENCNVFVAAHTSAGKTTVAEYAIALSQKHMTRVVYTSPIKALSNQKYREFKKKFESVGLLTGDMQINQNASCLIMTTEILQSMLYCASEVLRDLEFVIFDEVHYINNDDRGHVWEESVILLPQNVTIVMLSATVPNTMIFADWVGRTKKKKMYVISTLKRPVPLQHYLYTGTDGKTKNDRFLVLDEKGQFMLDGWCRAAKGKEPNAQNPKNPYKDNKLKTRMTPKQEQVLWSAFISHLKTQKLLPIVVFMLSRKRCDMSAVLLRNVDLTTETEKHCIRAFFQNNIRHLKGSDRQLPQVLMMQELLQNGIGIHHSGILPILKEIVEMLFQNGVVKLLFATETFAMGVNMPARTVVFDSIKKYDGTNFRILHPTEYIQMAGRAGRRGHDTTGVVIVMCRRDVPHFNELKTMMCGQPQTLESKFKVTYSMVLNLRRINESVTVEAMMRRSFKESAEASKHNKYKIELEKIEQDLSKLPTLTETQKRLVQFYQAAVEYLDYLKYLKPYLLDTKKAVKSLIPRTVLLISYKNHLNKLALLLNVVKRKNEIQYEVLVLKNSSHSSESETANKLNNSDKFYDIVALTKKEIFVPSGAASSEVITISAWNVLEITSCQLNVSCDLVLASWEKKQIPRFKNDPPGPAYETATQLLMTWSLDASRDHSILQPYVELKLNYDTDSKVQHLLDLKNAVDDLKCSEILNFEEQFAPIFERSEMESKKQALQLKLSDEGLSLYPDYTNAVSLLKHLGYIDNDERVALKGRVALQMGSNELLITELILKNVLTVLRPAEIAALLSTIIFQQRTDIKPKLTQELEKGCKVITQIYAELESLEQHYRLCTLSPLNFGLVEVVYDWAQAKSFAEIMEKTDVQEGIIVRCIQKLCETLQDVKIAAVTIGDPVLKEKMEEASTAIKRDIVFAASLYTQD